MATAKRDRWLVLAGIVSAWFASGAFIYVGVALARSSSLFNRSSAVEAVALALLLAALPLFAGIGWAARTRHFKSNIDGSKPSAGSALDLILRFITNTTEQLVLFSIASFGAAIFLPATAVYLLPVMGAWFVIARAAFFIGYRRNPLARAFGFASTFHPTIVLGGFALVAAL